MSYRKEEVMQIASKERVVVDRLTAFKFTLRCRACGFTCVTVPSLERMGLVYSSEKCSKCFETPKIKEPIAEPQIVIPKPKMKIIPINRNQGRVIKHEVKKGKHGKRS